MKQVYTSGPPGERRKSQRGWWIRLVTAVAAVLLFMLPMVANAQLGAGGLIIFGDRTIRESVASTGAIVRIAAGGNHVVAAREDGSLICWGNDTYGQCDVPSSIVSNVRAVGAGTNHTLVITNDGTVHAWGDDTYGQCDVPPGLTNAFMVVGGDKFSACLDLNGVVTVWGQIAAVPSNIGYVLGISAGYGHIVVEQRGDTVLAWGDNTYGQCNVPANLPFIQNIVAGAYHTVVLGYDHHAYAWGLNSSGQCNVPVLDTSNSANWFTQTAAGQDFTTLMTVPGGVFTCGANTDNESTMPSLLTNVANVVSGLHFTAFLSYAGNMFVYGDSTYGQATQPLNMGNFASIASHGNHIVGLKNDGTVACWGDDMSEQGAVPNFGGLAAVQVAAGHDHSMALLSNGTVKAWGSTQYGQSPEPSGEAALSTIGASFYDSFGAKSTGAPVGWGLTTLGRLSFPSGLLAYQLDGGYAHSVARTTSGTVKCWGDNTEGQLNVPAGLTGVTQIAAGYGHTLALTSAGNVKAWGWNVYGQATVPAGLANVAQVAAGTYHSVALGTNGVITCWGSNASNQSVIPAGLNNNIAAIAAGDNMTACLSNISIAIAPFTIQAQSATQSYGTIYLASPAPINGTTLTLVSSNPGLISVPGSITIPARATSAQFPITEMPSAQGGYVMITASFGSFSCSAMCRAAASTGYLTISPGSFVGGSETAVTGTFTLEYPAESVPMKVTLSSSDPSVTVPASVSIPANSTTATFTLTTLRVSTPTPVQISATAGGQTDVVTVTNDPVQVLSLSASPTMVVGGNSTNLTALLNTKMRAPVILSITSSDTSTIPNVTMTIPADATDGHAVCPTNPNGASEAVALSTSLFGSTVTTNVTVLPLLKSMTIPAGKFYGNTELTCTVTLNGPAPAGGVTVALACNDTCQATASFSIAAGKTSGTFLLFGDNVPFVVNALVTANVGPSFVSATKELDPNTMTFTVSPTSVVGGSSTQVQGTATMAGTVAAPTLISFTASDPSSVTMPASIWIPAGFNSTTITITTSVVGASEVNMITAANGTATAAQKGLTILPWVRNMTASGSTWYGNTASNFIVYLNGPAPTGGMVVTLAGTNCTPPSSVTVAAGATAANFAPIGANVATNTTGTVTASVGPSSTSASSTIVQNAVTGVTVSPASFVGGTSSAIKGTVSLTKTVVVATVITLSSSNTAVVGVPATVTIPAGAHSATFAVTSHAVTATTAVKISTSGANGVASATVTVNP